MYFFFVTQSGIFSSTLGPFFWSTNGCKTFVSQQIQLQYKTKRTYVPIDIDKKRLKIWLDFNFFRRLLSRKIRIVFGRLNLGKRSQLVLFGIFFVRELKKRNKIQVRNELKEYCDGIITIAEIITEYSMYKNEECYLYLKEKNIIERQMCLEEWVTFKTDNEINKMIDKFIDCINQKKLKEFVNFIIKEQPWMSIKHFDKIFEESKLENTHENCAKLLCLLYFVVDIYNEKDNFYWKIYHFMLTNNNSAGDTIKFHCFSISDCFGKHWYKNHVFNRLSLDFLKYPPKVTKTLLKNVLCVSNQDISWRDVESQATLILNTLLENF